MFSFATVARSISFGCKTNFLKGALSLVQGGASYTRFLMPAIYSHRLKRSLNLRNLCMSLVHQEYEQKMKGIHPDFFLIAAVSLEWKGPCRTDALYTCL